MTMAATNSAERDALSEEREAALLLAGEDEQEDSYKDEDNLNLKAMVKSMGEDLRSVLKHVFLGSKLTRKDQRKGSELLKKLRVIVHILMQKWNSQIRSSLLCCKQKAAKMAKRQTQSPQ